MEEETAQTSLGIDNMLMAICYQGMFISFVIFGLLEFWNFLVSNTFFSVFYKIYYQVITILILLQQAETLSK